MATDWKAEAAALRKKASKLRKKLKALEGAIKEALAAAPPQPPPQQPARTRPPGQVSPLAPPGGFPALPAIAGVEFAAAAAGVRYRGRTDVMLVRLAPGTSVAGAFTRSATRAASVLDCEAKLALHRDESDAAGAAILVNSGNANAFTGAAGARAVAALAAGVAAAAGVPEGRVFTASTGVIGEPLPHDRIAAVLPELAARLDPGGIAMAARAIMTTDTFPKGAWAEVATATGPIRIAGIAKGSGMIAPDLGTMLAYIFTDATVPRPALQRMASRQVATTFNAISVDGDTSTSDALLVCATGRGPGEPLGDPRGRLAREFEAALHAVMHDLALQVVRDGEGATRLVEVRVTGAADAADARRVAMAIANSPLVKTAIAGGDANWGRVVMAVGKSGAKADRDRLAIRFGDITVARDGARAPDYDEAAVAAYMQQSELVLAVDLGLGSAARTVWTCDLTHRYIDINADYRS
jgi:glutamate N-acetyltransferase/amino-acid N-acetyltransferase